MARDFLPESDGNAAMSSDSGAIRSAAAQAYAPGAENAAFLQARLSQSDQNIVPALTISFEPESTAAAQPDLSATTDTAAVAEGTASSRWTYLVNVAASDVFTGSDEFKALADLTRGTSDQVIVQSSNQTDNQISRLRIADGQVTDLGTVTSGGIAADTKSLIELAPQDGQLALIDDIHGSGFGFKGDNGEASVSDMKAAIDKGLNGRQLSLLDLNSCLMGTNEALNGLGTVANSIIASEAVEFAPAQPIAQSLAGMLQDRPTDGTDAANRIIENTALVCKPEDCPVSVLAAYDTSKQPSYSAATDDFADQLQNAVQASATNRDAINTAIDRTPSFAGDEYQLRDTTTFANNIVDAIKSGAISDPDHTLENSASNLLSAQANLVSASFSYGNTENPAPMNGLSTFLPAANTAENTYNLLGDNQSWSDFVQTLRAPDVILRNPDEAASVIAQSDDPGHTWRYMEGTLTNAGIDPAPFAQVVNNSLARDGSPLIVSPGDHGAVVSVADSVLAWPNNSESLTPSAISPVTSSLDSPTVSAPAAGDNGFPVPDNYDRPTQNDFGMPVSGDYGISESNNFGLPIESDIGSSSATGTGSTPGFSDTLGSLGTIGDLGTGITTGEQWIANLPAEAQSYLNLWSYQNWGLSSVDREFMNDSFDWDILDKGG